MLARRGFLWLIAAALAGLLPALLLAGHTARAALEQASLARLAAEAEDLAQALQSPQPPALPPGALLISAAGARLAGDPAVPDSLLQNAAAAVSQRQAMALTAGLLARQPLHAADGTVLGAVVLWQPAAGLEARLAGILLRGLRDAAVLFLLCLPAAWIGARLLLGPVAAAALGGAALLDALRSADITAEQAEHRLEPGPVLEAASEQADLAVVAAATAAGALLNELDASAAAMLRAEAEGAPA
ncbi:hypothetical protein GCM10011504_27020 [Siccirubricoccus deserti]|uniref:Uncharacterized protein n=1 Tax=Siccirubricoccus deserti TaxID=2013562 RepID=A0A9X0R0Q6_9PROT|nr:hypothetical protein [Siccirubricoccus deserti]MBC4016338.1 hypothetical protein [Siccirubricoccus deserti]GGC47126.1 hypothetical protein GCM10011504_27020 [Siccirubricoccus deserti]